MDDLRTRLTTDLKEAMRARDSVRTETIRAIRAAMILREVELGGDLDDDGIQKLIVGLVKQRVDSIEQYRLGGRQDLVEREEQEKALLEAYLPAAPDEAAVESAVAAVIAELKPDGMKDMGKVMQACKAKLGPAVDGKQLSALVRAALTTAIVLLAFACGGAQKAAAKAQWRTKLRAAMHEEVSDRDVRDSHSRLLVAAVDAGAVDGMLREDIRAAFGPGLACASQPVCDDQGFAGEDWYYEIGVMTDPKVKQLPLLLMSFDPMGRLTRVFTLTTH